MMPQIRKFDNSRLCIKLNFKRNLRKYEDSELRVYLHRLRNQKVPRSLWQQYPTLLSAAPQIHENHEISKIPRKEDLSDLRSALVVCIYSASSKRSCLARLTAKREEATLMARGSGWFGGRWKREERRESREREKRERWKSEEVVKRDRDAGVFNTRLVSVAAKVLGR